MHAPLVVILAGGSGTRVRHLLPGLPKPLAPVAGRPFLEWVIRYLRKQGVASIVISAGFLADRIEAFAAEQKVACVKEPVALGTGGGFLNGLESFQDSAADVLVCNGDSLVLTDLAPLLHALDDRAVDSVLLGVRVADASRFGTLKTDGGGRLLGFAEKHPGAGLVNGGVYLFRRATVAWFPAKRPLSFEYDVFPSLVSQDVKLKVVSCAAPFLDIGTEETLMQADAFIKKNMAWFE